MSVIASPRADQCATYGCDEIVPMSRKYCDSCDD